MKKEVNLSPAVFWMLLIVLAPIWITIVISAFIAGLLYVVIVLRPIVIKLQLQPNYWLTWHDVKRATGARTSTVLELLSGDIGLFESRPRSKETLERLARHYSIPFPRSGTPKYFDSVIFFEFRVVRRGGRRRFDPFSFLKQIGNMVRPKPVLQPAYA